MNRIRHNVVRKTFIVSYRTPNSETMKKTVCAESKEAARLRTLSDMPAVEILEIVEQTEAELRKKEEAL